MKHSVSLANWKQDLRPYQQAAVDKALAVKQGGMLLLSSPTGTGKGTMELGLLKALREQGKRAWIVTPSIEVLRGYLERCGATAEDLDAGAGKLVSLGRRIKVTTPVRMRNMLRGRKAWSKGKRVRRTLTPPDVIIIDEAHHATHSTVAGGGLRKLAPEATLIGFTATPYRSTPSESGDLQQTWGEPYHVLTIPMAIENGAWALPKWRIEPLINDDNCGIVAGDIDADEATITAAHPIADLVASLDLSVPTCITITTVKAAKEVHAALISKGLDARLVLAGTPTIERGQAYEATKAGKAVLVSVRVLGEGVDLPWLRRWVDASPTLSPVCFLQKLGRITRPHASGQPEYVGTNRNLERHGYLLQGAIPRLVIKMAQERFGAKGSKRGARAGLVKGVGKAKPIELPLEDGIKGTMWALWCPGKMGGSGFERCVMIDPTSDRVFSAVRSIDNSKEGSERWGKWTLEKKVPKKLEGFKASRLGGKCSELQLKLWNREAANRGLDASVVPTRSQFFAIPVLRDLKTSMRPDGRTLRPEPEEAATDPKDVTNGVSAAMQPDKRCSRCNVAHSFFLSGSTEVMQPHFLPGTNGQCPGSKLPWVDKAPQTPASPAIYCSECNATLSSWRKSGDSMQTHKTWVEGKGGKQKYKVCLGSNLPAVTKAVKDAQNEDAIHDSLGVEQKKKHETSSEGNIPLMKRLLAEGKSKEEIEKVYVERYKLEGKKNINFVRGRIKIYKKIARGGVAHWDD